jgi:hypothetical protein
MKKRMLQHLQITSLDLLNQHLKLQLKKKLNHKPKPLFKNKLQVFKPKNHKVDEFLPVHWLKIWQIRKE